MTAHSRDDTPQIHKALTRLRTTTGVPLAFGGPVNDHLQVQLSAFDGSNRGVMRGVVLDAGLGLGGKVALLRRPMVLNDYVGSAHISHHYDRIIKAEALRGMTAAPVVVRRQVRGVLYGAIRSATPLGDRIVQSVVDAARDLEQNLAIHDELARRIDLMQAHTMAIQTGDAGPPKWEQVREIYAEMRTLLQQISDTPLREQMNTVCDRLAAVCAPSAPAAERLLAPREVDVLAYVALGWTNPHIAADLGLHPETVKSYLRNAMRKLRCHTRLEAVVTARRLGLLP